MSLRAYAFRVAFCTYVLMDLFFLVLTGRPRTWWDVLLDVGMAWFVSRDFPDEPGYL